MRGVFLFFLFLTSTAYAENVLYKSQRVIFSAELVASSCHVKVISENDGGNLMTFSTYNKSTGVAVPSIFFSIQLYESGSSLQGCSAFQVGNVAAISFGNPGQLDSSGVVTYGSGDLIRIDVRATDTQADYRGPININNQAVKYPVDFAKKGLFRFVARPIFPDSVKVGEYSGALAFVIQYQ